jgi:hypothetical protein
MKKRFFLGNVLFQPLNPRRSCEGKNRNKCMPKMQSEKVYLPWLGKG